MQYMIDKITLSKSVINNIRVILFSENHILNTQTNIENACGRARFKWKVYILSKKQSTAEPNKNESVHIDNW